MAKITSNYDYVTSSQRSIIESNIPEKLSVIQDNLLDFEISFQSFDWARDEMQKISKELVSMGRYFAAQHRLDETHTLINGIKSEVTNNYGIKFYNDARNSRGQFYAGHHEYGFHARDGSFVEARPFMRPALYAVSRASQGEFSTILEELLRGTFTEGGYKGVSNLSFGKELGGYRNFSNLNTTLTNMMSSSTINPRYFTAENLEKDTRKPWSAKRTVFSDKKNTLHKEDIGWRNIKESVRGGRSINRSKLASIKYALSHSQKTRTRIIRQKNVSVGRTIYNPANKIQTVRQNQAIKRQQMDKMWKEHNEKIKQEYNEYNSGVGNKGGKKGGYKGEVNIIQEGLGKNYNRGRFNKNDSKYYNIKRKDTEYIYNSEERKVWKDKILFSNTKRETEKESSLDSFYKRYPDVTVEQSKARKNLQFVRFMEYNPDTRSLSETSSYTRQQFEKEFHYDAEHKGYVKNR